MFFFKLVNKSFPQTKRRLARSPVELPLCRLCSLARSASTHISVKTEREDGRRRSPRSPRIHLQPIRYSNGSFLLINSCVHWDRFGNLLALTLENCSGSPAPPWLLASINLISAQKGPERPRKVLLCLFFPDPVLLVYCFLLMPHYSALFFFFIFWPIFSLGAIYNL